MRAVSSSSPSLQSGSPVLKSKNQRFQTKNDKKDGCKLVPRSQLGKRCSFVRIFHHYRTFLDLKKGHTGHFYRLLRWQPSQRYTLQKTKKSCTKLAVVSVYSGAFKLARNGVFRKNLRWQSYNVTYFLTTKLFSMTTQMIHESYLRLKQNLLSCKWTHIFGSCSEFSWQVTWQQVSKTFKNHRWAYMSHYVTKKQAQDGPECDFHKLQDMATIRWPGTKNAKYFKGHGVALQLS